MANFRAIIKISRKHKMILTRKIETLVLNTRKNPYVQPLFAVSRCAFCKLQRNFGFSSQRTSQETHHLLVIGAFRSTLFVSVFQDSLLVIVLFRAIIDQFSSQIFLIILILVSCPRQKVHSSSLFPSLFLSSLESFSVLFLQAKLGECFAL